MLRSIAEKITRTKNMSIDIGRTSMEEDIDDVTKNLVELERDTVVFSSQIKKVVDLLDDLRAKIDRDDIELDDVKDSLNSLFQMADDLVN